MGCTVLTLTLFENMQYKWWAIIRFAPQQLVLICKCLRNLRYQVTLAFPMYIDVFIYGYFSSQISDVTIATALLGKT